MSKKSLIASLIFGAIATLSLGVYTLVSAIVALTTPHHNKEALAFTDTTLVNGVREELVIGDFVNYSEEDGTLKIEYQGEDKLLEFNAEDKTYTLAKDSEGYSIAFGPSATAGDKVSFVVVATTDKYGSTITYDVSIYHQGSGASAEDPYIVANAEGLKSVAADVDSNPSELYDGYVKVVEDVDMAGETYSPIGKQYPFEGHFDGNGKAIKNLAIVVNQDNYQDYLRYDANADKFVMTLGLFGWTGTNTSSAEIKGVALSNASIFVDDNVKDALAGNVTVGEHTATFHHMRAGLLIGEAYNTVVDGSYVDGEETLVATVAGSISGLQVKANWTDDVEEPTHQSAFGGLVGVAETNDASTVAAGSFKNYKVDVSMRTSAGQVYDYNGGVFGLVLGANGHVVEAKDIEVTLAAQTQFHQYKYVGGFAAFSRYIDADNLTINVKAVDSDGATVQDLNNIIASETYSADDFEAFSKVAGVAVYANNSVYSNVNSTANISLWTRLSAGFVSVKSSELENVITSGTLVGYNVSGLVHTVQNSEISYANDAEEALVAANINLFGHDAVALVDNAKNTNIKATGKVSVVSDIQAYGYRVVNDQKNNIVHSSGLVGFFFADDAETSHEYELSGFDIKTVINNGVDMAGVVTYLGQQNGYAAVKVANINVEADLIAYGEANYTSAHKVGGAVATVYGNATLDTVKADVNFNKDHGTGSHGAAMFGGLVARVGGKVAITNCETEGYAYINDSFYRITLENTTTHVQSEFKQILAGGLVGAIAGFTTEAVEPGKHPVYAAATEDGFAKGDTRDELLSIGMGAGAVVITGNKANVDIDIAYVQTYDGTNAMFGGGYRARSVGSLIGLILNSGNSTTNLSTNHAYGIIAANKETYNVGTATNGIFSTCGFGSYNAAQGTYTYSTAKVVGCTYDLINSGDYNALWAMPSVEEKSAA